MVDLKKIAAIGIVFSSALILSACNLYKSPPTQTNQNQQSQTAVDQSPVPGANAIVYSDSGFSPASLTVKIGETVEFKNNSQNRVQVNSDPHPTHTLFPVLNIGQIAPGESSSVTFDKAGTYTYHNHLNVSQTGTIMVE